MTAWRPTTRRALLALGGLALAAAWVLAATLLWRTSVPDDLALPSLDPHRFFSAAELDRTASYQAFLRVDQLLAAVAQLAALGVYAVVGARFARESAAGRIGTGMLLGMLGLGFVWLAQFPFGLAAVWWERQHDVVHPSYLGWIVADLLAVGPQFLFISLALLIVMALAGLWRRLWWITAVPVLGAVAVAFVFLQPYLIPGLDPLHNPRLASDARRLAAAEGVPGTPVRVQDTHDLGGPPNAEAVGVGSSRRVVLWDTLIRRFPPSEVRVVMAHELGHLARHHAWKGLAWGALLALPIALVVALVTRGRGGLYEPGAVPLALFVVVAVLFCLTPLQNAFSRRLESEADWVALQTTRDPGAAVGLFRRFARVAEAQPQPPGWSRVLLADHPSIMQRIEMAKAWRERQAGAR